MNLYLKNKGKKQLVETNNKITRVGVAIRYDSNRPALLQKLATVLKFAKLQYVSSGFRCRYITGSLMRL